jgi:hypothetical protein
MNGPVFRREAAVSAERPALILALTVALAAPGPASAQEPVKSFDQLNTRVKPGDTVYVTDAQGRELKAKVRGLSASVLSLDAHGRVVLEDSDVRLITRHKPRPVGRYALLGMGVGAGVALAGLAAADLSNSDGTALATAVGVLVGAGAVAGAVVGAFTPGPRVVIYSAPSASGGRSAALVPIIAPRAKGVAVSFAF